MRNACSKYRFRLIEAAEGNADNEMLAHVAECANCSAEVNRIITVLAAAKGIWESAPSEIVQRAQSLMPETRRHLIGRRLGLGSFAGARGGQEEFQVLVGDEDVTIRLMASPRQDGWAVMGRVPGDDWIVEAQSPVKLDDTVFEFEVKTLDGSAFDLVGPDSILHIPALSELIDNDRD
jgi:hypothetical protein